ncbi:MAG: PilW family protein [Thermodesulfobacteriota bacterium]
MGIRVDRNRCSDATRKPKAPNAFSLVEVLMALALAGFVVGGIMKAFIAQSHSYKAQIMTASLQQNLRAAMNVLARDILLAGYYTSMDPRIYPACVDWNPKNPGREDLLPYIHGVDNINGILHYRNGTDSIVLVKASDDGGRLNDTEYGQSGGSSIKVDNLDLDEDGDVDLTDTARRFGVLVKSDYTVGQLFEIFQINNGEIAVKYPLSATYLENDMIARADVVIYRVDDANPTFSRSVLARKNVGNGDQFQVVAEDIVDLQCVYILGNGSEVTDPHGCESRIRAVKVCLRGEVDVPRQGKIQRVLESVVMVRNAPR